MRVRKKSKWVTVVVPCPNCGCGCDVELGGNDDAVTEVSDSERRVKRPRLNTPDPEPNAEPSTDAEPEPAPEHSSDYAPNPDLNTPEPSSDPDPSSDCAPDPDLSDSEFDNGPEAVDSDPDPYTISDEELDPTQPPPATHTERFFAKCPSFNYNPSQHIMAEFYRLCASGKVHRDKARRRFRDALTWDFNEMYGVEEDDLGAWQRLCRVLVTDIPNEIEACRKIVQSRFINIVDLVDTHITENPVLQFRSEAELSSYTQTTGKYFPNDSEHAGSLLKFLLRFIVFPTDAKIGEQLEMKEVK